MTITGDQSYIKNLNRTIVLNLLRFQGHLSRVEISRLTGLTKATVSAIIEQLMSEQYVVESGHVLSGGVGRRPVLLSFNPDAGRVIGVDLGVGYFRVLVMNLSAKVIRTYNGIIETSEGTEATVQQVLDTIHLAIRESAGSVHGVVGVGLCIPGLIDAKRGVVLNAPNLGWHDVELRSILEAELDVPVFIDNEANAGAIGEQLFGAGKGVSNMVFISLGHGIGTGIILNNQLIRGEAGIAGEFGHMTIDVNGPLCSCGNRGCLELYASEKAVIEQYQQRTGELLMYDHIVKRMEIGDKHALEALESESNYLGVGVASLVNALNPALILIGARHSSIQNIILDGMTKAIRERSFITPYSTPRIQMSALGELSSAIGAGALVLQAHFSGPESQDH